MKKNLLGLLWFLVFAAPAFAAGVYTPGMPQAGVYPNTYPLTGNERIPADTVLPEGVQPQSEAITVQQLLSYSSGVFGFTPQAVYNIVDYGAKCDGATDDTAAVNAAIAAAWARLNTSQNGLTTLKIVGPVGNAGSYCRVTAVNATGVIISATGSKLIFDDLRLNCNSTGNSNYGICFDATGSRYLEFGPGFHLSGSGSIGLQIGTDYLPIGVGSHACCTIEMIAPNVVGFWSFAAVYNDQAEGTHIIDPYFQNNGSTIGPIAATTDLGAITGGSGGTDGTYPAVPLTGGSGSGATANVTVTGGTVTNVRLATYGTGYKAGDTLSAASANIGGVTGFSVPVAIVSPFVYVMDGSNHWRHQSSFQAGNLASNPIPDTFYTFTQNMIIGGSLLYISTTTAPGVPLWTSYARSFTTHELYLYSGGGAPDIELFDNSASGSNANSNAGMGLYFTPEAGSVPEGSIFLYGSNAAPTLNGLRIRDYADGSQFIIQQDANISTVSATDIDWSFPYAIGGFLANPAAWTMNGRVDLPLSTMWSASINFTGLLCDPSCASFGALNSQATPWNIANLYSGAAPYISVDAPNATSAPVFRLWRTTTHGGAFIINVGNGANTIQTNLNANGASFMQAQAGSLAIGTSAYCSTGAELCVTGGAIQAPTYTIAALPACNAGLTGGIVFIYDTTAAANPTFHLVVAGGGSTTVKSLASCNGSNWQYN